MLLDYFQWQYVWGPRWFGSLFLRVQQALWTYYSVPYLIRTLFSYWHRDYIPWHGGTISQFVSSIIWNIFSRCLGFLVRTSFLSLGLLTEILFLIISVGFFLLFVLWPILALFLCLQGLFNLSVSL